MKFEWDEEKRKANIRKHGLDFVDATDFFNHPMLTRLDTRFDYGEDRWVGLGMILNHVIVIVFTERDNGETVRIISIRKALKNERRKYEELSY